MIIYTHIYTHFSTLIHLFSKLNTTKQLNLILDQNPDQNCSTSLVTRLDHCHCSMISMHQSSLANPRLKILNPFLRLRAVAFLSLSQTLSSSKASFLFSLVNDGTSPTILARFTAHRNALRAVIHTGMARGQPKLQQGLFKHR